MYVFESEHSIVSEMREGKVTGESGKIRWSLDV